MQNAAKAVSACVENGQLEVLFSTGMRGQWPLRILQFAKRTDGVLQNIRPNDEDLVEVEIWPSGEIIEFPRVDQAFKVAALMRGEVGNAEWMQQLSVGAL